MKQLTASTMESLTGGICVINPGTGGCIPSVCTGLAIAFAASGNPNIPQIVCIL